jgi:hypothetical protein
MRGHPVTERQITTIESCIRRGCHSLPEIARQSELSGRTVLRVVLDRFQVRLQAEHAARQLFELSDPHEDG